MTRASTEPTSGSGWPNNGADRLPTVPASRRASFARSGCLRCATGSGAGPGIPELPGSRAEPRPPEACCPGRRAGGPARRRRSCRACPSTGAAPYRTGAVLGEPRVVHRPRHRTKRRDRHLGQPSADRPPVRRRDRHELVQRLVVDLPSRWAIGSTGLRRHPAATHADSTRHGHADPSAATTQRGPRRTLPDARAPRPARPV
jgi:hypothetical protein